MMALSKVQNLKKKVFHYFVSDVNSFPKEPIQCIHAIFVMIAFFAEAAFETVLIYSLHDWHWLYLFMVPQ